MKDKSSLDYTGIRIDINGDVCVGDIKLGNIHTENYLTTNTSFISADKLYTTKIDDSHIIIDNEKHEEKHVELCPKINMFKSSKNKLNQF